MGAYLRKPVTDKTSESQEFSVGQMKIVFAASCMQGWRVSMEDAHFIKCDFDDNTALFAVFDGHGGREVAVYCATHLGDAIKATKSYANNDMSQALKDAFMHTDEAVITNEAVQEMKICAEHNVTKICSAGEDEDLERLVEESKMPLKALLARYTDNASSWNTAEENEDSISGAETNAKAVYEAVARHAVFGIEFDTSCSESEDEESTASDADSGLQSSADVSDNSVKEDCQSRHSDLTHCCTKSPDECTSTCAMKTSECIEETCLQPSCIDSGPVKMKPAVCNDTTRTSNPMKSVVTASSCDESSKSESCSQPVLKDLLTSPSPFTHTTSECHAHVSEATLQERHLQHSNKRSHPKDHCEDVDVSCPKRIDILDDEGYHSGTTAVVCMLRSSEVIVANSGDSRCVVSSNGKAVELSFDHKPTDLTELERIQRAGGCVGTDGRVNGGLNVSRAIGDHFYKQNTSLPLEEQMISAMPDIQTLSLTGDEEFIILACDGIWNSMSSQEVVDFVRHRIIDHSIDGSVQANDLERICESLCDACLAPDTDNDGTGCDNMTCIIVLLHCPSVDKNV